ncbi:restriction endonuclease subunit S [Bacillus tianshenii]|uniref:restriction endonuclease subunit S n=1 Tax=Sutcliffiella tianshenii TaxID=1463404 RepID=UPI001CD78D89|nr:restriction endonuclease subunit S [Bacillus tianshenii]MCA1321975.1 restriction endonuclease subunit S [Bacillus tianshenii]
MVRQGYKMTELGEMPEDWEVKKLGDILKIRYGKSQRQVEDSNGSIPILGTGGLMGYANKALYEEESVLIGRKGTIDKPYYMNEPFWTVDTLFYSEIFKPNVPKWIFYLFQSIPWKSYNEATGVPSLSGKIIESIKICLPSNKEQQKIADILSTVDAQLEQTDQLIKKTKELKKGLMQKLLKKGIGHTGFKQTEVGEIPAEWECVQLKDILEVQGGYAFKSKDSVQEGIRWIKIANVGMGKISWKEKSYLPTNFEEEYSDYVLKSNDIVMAMTRPVLRNETKISRIERSDTPSLLNQRVCRFIFSNKINNSFFYHFARTISFAYSIQDQILGTDPPNISANQIKSIYVPLPPLPEQQKIADILSSVDGQLEGYNTKKEKLELLKKGLMQQLLTGKVRVSV